MSAFRLSISDLARFLNRSPQETKQLLSQVTGQPWVQTQVPPELVRDLLLLEKKSYPFQKVVSIQMLKGGVAKTTTLLNVGLRAAMYGARVLFIDLDQQANLSFALGHDNEANPVWLDIFEKRKNIDECIKCIDMHIDLIPSSLNNSVLDRVMLNSNRNWAQAIKAPLDKIKHRYDLILLDTAPALSAVNTAVTVASDLIILPVNPDRFSVLGLEKNLSELKDIQNDFSLDFKIKILFTKFDGREKTSHDFLQHCMNSYDDLLMKNFIRTSAEVKNSVVSTKHIFDSKAAVKEDFDSVTRELLEFLVL